MTYTGLCLGGPLTGQWIENYSTTYQYYEAPELHSFKEFDLDKEVEVKMHEYFFKELPTQADARVWIPGHWPENDWVELAIMELFKLAKPPR